ncbi:polysaccharide deacetylase family protein [Streptomyces sp. NPDC001102]
MPRLASQGRPDRIALTFDDRPDPLSTPHFLRLLAVHRVAATFFPPGRQARRSPALSARSPQTVTRPASTAGCTCLTEPLAR